LLTLFSKFKIKATFLILGWVANKYPDLVKKIARQGHEIGCHGFYHRVIDSMTPEEFELDTSVALKILRRISKKPVDIFRAPCFSITNKTLWAYPILAKLGIKTDVSIVPARRDNGGIPKFTKDPVVIRTSNGNIRVIPVSVMDFLHKRFQFSGGGYLRFLPYSIIQKGFEQNLSQNRSVMSFIHPREINFNHPRINFPLIKYFKSYYGLNTVENKLTNLFSTFSFSTVSEVYSNFEIGNSFLLNSDNKLIKES